MKSFYSTGRELVVGKTISGLKALGGDAPPPPPPAPTTALVKSDKPWWKPEISIDKVGGAAAVAGGVAGGVFWKDHRVLGVLCGMTAGRAVPAFIKGSAADKHEAIAEIAATGCGTLLALTWDEHPAVAFVIGAIGGDILAKYVMKGKS